MNSISLALDTKPELAVISSVRIVKSKFVITFFGTVPFVQESTVRSMSGTFCSSLL